MYMAFFFSLFTTAYFLIIFTASELFKSLTFYTQHSMHFVSRVVDTLPHNAFNFYLRKIETKAFMFHFSRYNIDSRL